MSGRSFLAAAWVSAALGSPAFAQSNNLVDTLPYEGPPGHPLPPLPVTLDEVSPIKLPTPTPFRVHDLITIDVNEVILNRTQALLNRRREVEFDYQLEEFVVILDGLRLRNDDAIEADEPSIDLEAENTDRKQFQLNRADQLSYSIQAQVAEVRPNGNLVLEAHGEVTVNNDRARYRLSGVCSPLDVDPVFRAVDSTKLANKRVELVQTGAGRDALKRGFVVRIIDWFQPF